MVPDKFIRIDLHGIDVLESQGEEIPGLYSELVESIQLCRYQIIYNWKFNGILISPTYVELQLTEDGVKINRYITVTSDDIVHIYSIEIPPVIDSISISENGEYIASGDIDGFNPVIVDVPVILENITITENGIYTVPQGKDGYGTITVEVGESGMNLTKLFESEGATSGSLTYSYTDYSALLIVVRQDSDLHAKCSSLIPIELIGDTIPVGGCIVSNIYCYITFPTATTFTGSRVSGAKISEIYGIS